MGMMSQFFGRLAELKSATNAAGKPVLTKRIVFQIQDLIDMRHNQWVKKVFRDQAKTKDEVRKDALKEKQKGNAIPSFSTQLAGVRPSYVVDTSKSKGQRGGKAAEQPARQGFDQKEVRKMIDYFADERNGDGLEQDWNDAKLAPKEAKKAVKGIIEMGIYEPRLEDACAHALTELVLRQVIAWDTLEDQLTPALEQLEEYKLDSPQADVFFHSLLSYLLLQADRDFNVSLLRSLPSNPGTSRGLLFGTLKKLRERAGPDAVWKALHVGHSEVETCVCRVAGCDVSDLEAVLRSAAVF
eukprot:NODE_1368_length_1164_cov_340.973850.p1 GENE.NODE_1368_length_1164_cov_340.973850~~NODE_1368_length_1164_cov_340.973850.p1  ORF type:complete len:298 (+),score=73.97 NODE_1368_length_1164_cov_340.973850:3-896(+)